MKLGKIVRSDMPIWVGSGVQTGVQTLVIHDTISLPPKLKEFENNLVAEEGRGGDLYIKLES